MNILTNFTNLATEKLKMTLAWRNTPIVRENMYSKDEISLEKHLSFIESLKNAKDKAYFLVTSKDNTDIGVIYFTDISNLSCTMGIYANPKIRGIGKTLMKEIIEYGFTTLQCEKIKSEVYITNIKAISLYKKFGFKEITRDKKVLFMELQNENR